MKPAKWRDLSGDELDQVWGVNIAQGERLPLGLVPTTAGTGSEATPISVITCEGGVKLAVGLAHVLKERLAIVVNTGDDFSHLGLHISPDVDTVLYSLAGVVNEETGWGRRR